MKPLITMKLPFHPFTSARDRDRMELLINKLKRSGFLQMSAPSFSTLANEADQRLFRAVTQDPNHVLRKFLPKAGVQAIINALGSMGSSSLQRTTDTLFLTSYHHHHHHHIFVYS